MHILGSDCFVSEIEINSLSIYIMFPYEAIVEPFFYILYCQKQKINVSISKYSSQKCVVTYYHANQEVSWFSTQQDF